MAVTALSFAGALGSVPLAAQSGGKGDVLARSVALYPTLASYADTGTVVIEAPGVTERYKFTTRYRRDSLDFFLDFQGVAKQGAGGSMDWSFHRIVLWMIKGELQAFNNQQKTHETIPRASGRQVPTMRGFSLPTQGVSILTPALIFSQAGLPGVVQQMQKPTDAGFETVAGRRCHKVIAMAAEYYPNGQITNARQVTAWIDADTLLIRKVFEDTPKGSSIGYYFRKTTTIEPQANPALDDSTFRFAVPTFQR
jgi:hypothetical protein